MNELGNPVPGIADAIAEAEDAEPRALDPPQAEVVDPDALEALIEDTTASELEIHFA